MPFNTTNAHFHLFLPFSVEELGVHSPTSESPEDSYITKTSVAPSAVYSAAIPTLLIGSSVEAIILDLIKQVEVCQTS